MTLISFREKYGPNVAVIGASTSREKYSNKAVRAFLDDRYNVFPVNPKADSIEGLKCYPAMKDIEERIDFVSIYLPAEVSLKINLPAQLLKKKVKAVIINPGAEHDELISQLKEAKIEVLMVCSIVSLGKNPDVL